MNTESIKARVQAINTLNAHIKAVSEVTYKYIQENGFKQNQDGRLSARETNKIKALWPEAPERVQVWIRGSEYNNAPTIEGKISYQSTPERAGYYNQYYIINCDPAEHDWPEYNIKAVLLDAQELPNLEKQVRKLQSRINRIKAITKG